MANSKTIQINLKAVSDFKDVISNVKQIQGVINQLKLPPELANRFKNLFGDVEKYGEKAASALASGFKTKGDVSAYAKNINAVNQALTAIQRSMQNISRSDLRDSLNIDPTALKNATDQVIKYRNELSQIGTGVTGFQELEKRAKELSEKYKNLRSDIKDFTTSLKSGNIDDAKKKFTELSKALGKMNMSDRKADYEQFKTLMKNALDSIDITKLTETQEKLLSAKNALDDLSNTELQNLVNEFDRLTGIDIRKLVDQTYQLGENEKEAATETQGLNSELDQIKGRIQYFFGLNNAVRLFQQAVRSAFNTIKDLDKVMTETAVVTKFDVGDMWSQLPEYTKRANELGISIHDAYEAATLYYQQGLDTNEVMAVSNETLKMARIAGLEAADATDRMTNALRGFNMEITEANAQNINDVYSNLAAKTASNVDEISTAMTKVASLANNANMSFENTAAFLSQIIETTRESAETAGTALKTVIARFSEVKSLYSEGELLGTDTEGEEINVNKISTALRTAGINLNEYLTGMKGLDQIFMELSAKWDGLDQVQQRYIATMAAGSRQQSRFIALMQDNARMTELVKEANNANGASQEQFEKTLDSLETKLNQLKNAWDTYLMAITNNEIIKSVIDLLTDLLTTINNLTSGLGGLEKGIANLGIAFGGLKLGKSLLNKLFGSLGSAAFKPIAKMLGKGIGGELGKVGGEGISKGLTASLTDGIKKIKTDGLGKLFKEKFINGFKAKEISPSELGIKPDQLIDINSISNVTDDLKIALQRQVKDFEIPDEAKIKVQGLIESGDIKGAQSELQQFNQELKVTGQVAEETGTKVSTDTARLKTLGTASVVTGAALLALTGILQSTGVISDKAAGYIRVVAIALMAFPVVLRVVEAAVKVFSINVTGSIMSIPIVGWIAAVITALTALVALFVKLGNENSAEAKLEAATEAAEKAAEAANQAAEAYKNLNESFEGLGDKYKTLEDLTVGTQEWRDAVQDLNLEVLELIKEYPELAKFVQNEGGVLKIDLDDSAVQAILNKYQEQVFITSAASAQAEIEKAQREIDVRYENVQLQENVNRQVLDPSDFVTSSDIKQATEQVALALAGDAEALEYFERQGIKRAGDSLGDFGRKLTEHFGVFQSLSDKEAEGLKDFGEYLQSQNLSIQAFNDSISSSIILLSKFNNEEKKYAENYLSSNRIQQIYNKLETALNASGPLMNNNAYVAYWNKQGGVVKDNSGTVEINGEKIEASAAKQQYLSAKTVEEEKKAVEDFVKALNNASDSVKKLYSGKEGRDLTTKDLAALGVTDYEGVANLSIEEIKENYKGIIQGFADGLGISAEDFENFANDYAEAVKIASTAHVDAIKRFKDQGVAEAFEGLTSNMSAGNKKAIADNIAEVMTFSGAVGAEELISSLGSMLSTLSNEEKTKFITALNSIDWTNLSDISGLNDILKNTGVYIDSADENFQKFIEDLIDLSGAFEKVNVKKLVEQLDKLNPLRAKLLKGEQDRTFSKDEYESLIEANPELAGSFVKNLEGEYVYLGNTMDDLRIAIENATDVLVESAKKRLDQKIEASEGLQVLRGQTFTARAYYDTDTWAKGQGLLRDSKEIGINQILESNDTTLKRQFLESALSIMRESGDISNLEISGLSNDTTVDSIIKSGQLDAVIAAVIQFMNQSEEFKGQRSQIGRDVNVSTMLGESANYLAEHIDEEGAKEALLAQAQAAKISEEAYMEYATALESADEADRQFAATQMATLINLYDEAEALGIDTEELEAYAKQLQETNKGLSDVSAMRIALANKKLNTGLREIIDSYKEWTPLIKKNGELVERNNIDDEKTFDKLKTSVQKMLNANTELSDEFWNSKENMLLLKKAAEGDVEALAKLQEAALWDYTLTIKVEDNQLIEEVQAAISKIYNILTNTDLPPLKPGMVLDDFYKDADELYKKLNEIIENSGLTATQVNEMFSRMGYEVDIEYKTISWQQPVFDAAGLGKPGRGGGGRLNAVTIENYSYKVPQIKMRGIKGGSGSKGSGYSLSNQNSGKDNKPKSSSKKDSGSKPSNWKNPYDELFNLQEKINEALRQREALERRYDKLLKSEKASVSEIRKGYFDQIKALREEINLQQQFQAGRKRQIQNLGSETYTDKDGNRRTFSSLGVTKYAKYDFSTGRITIDWEGLEKIAKDSSRTAEGEAAEAYINKLQELVDSYEETRDAIWEFEDKIEDLMKEAIDSYTSFEDRVKDALVNQYQKEIDTLQAMSDAITEATNKIIDSIQEQIEAERRERQNQKTEQDIADKEARLAYLRRDTSGANELQIRQLEKELEEARQSYEDTLIDQTLDQMRKDADLAAEQRQMQIDIMQEQLQQSIDTGKIWNEVWALMQESIAEDGTLDFNSALIKMLQESEAFKALSAFGQDEWIKELVEAFHRAVEGLAAGGAAEFGQHESSGAASGESPGGSNSTSTTPAAGSGADSPTSAPTSKSSPYGLLPSETSGIIGKGSKKTKSVKTLQWALNELGYTDKSGKELVVDGVFGDKTEYALTQFQLDESVGPKLGPNGLGKMGDNTRGKFKLNGYAKGGLADFTGPAWLDGSRAHPELVLSARDTENFITLKDILADAFGAGDTASTKFGDTYIDIDVNADIGSDYDVDRLVEELKNQIVRDSLYRNVTPINFMR